MQTKWFKKTFAYDGTQLRSLYAYLEEGILGDSIVAWQGPCRIEPEHIVDGEDLLAGAEIAGDQMLHFIVEKFDCTLLAAVGLQRLMASLVIDALKELSDNKSLVDLLERSGDDVYVEQKKLSISIATQSPVSSLIHFAVNIVNEGTPVETISLSDFAVDAKDFASHVMAQFQKEVNSMVEATHKVRWVR